MMARWGQVSSRWFYRLWDPIAFAGVPTFLFISGALLILAYAFMKLAFYDAFGFVEPLLGVVCLYVFFRYGGKLRTTLPLTLLWLSVVVALVVWLSGMLSHPELMRSSPKLEHLARHFIFVFMAFWIAGSVRNVLIFWLAAVLGLLLAPWVKGDGWVEFMAGFEGVRPTFGLQNAQHVAVLFGIVLIGMLVFFRRIVFVPRFCGLRFVAWTIVFAYTLLILLLSQTRAVYVALALLLLITLGLLAVQWLLGRRTQPLGWRSVLQWSLGGLLAGLLMLWVAVASNMVTPVYERFTDEMVVLDALAAGDLDAVPLNNLGSRVISWRAAAHWFLERPVLGWGSQGGKLVMQHTPWITDEPLLSFGHLHSSYIEMLIRYGLLGALIYLVLIVWTGTSAWRAWKAGVMPTDFFLFFNLLFVYWLSVNVFESYMFYWTGVYAFNVVMAVLLSFIWREQHGVVPLPKDPSSQMPARESQ